MLGFTPYLGLRHDGVKNANGTALIVGGGIRCCLPNKGDNYLPCFDLCFHFHQCTSLSNAGLTATCEGVMLPHSCSPNILPPYVKVL